METALRNPRPARGLIDSNPRLALAVADVNWFTTENLFREVGRENVSTLLLDCSDYVNAWRRGLPWRGTPLRARGPHRWRREVVLPSGWMKRYPRIGMRPIASSILDWQRREVGESELTLVMTYPYYLFLRDQVRPARSVYFNVDDYSLYWPRHADRVNELERRAVRESDLTICVSRLRAEALRAIVPEASDRVRHLPHGAPSWFLTEHPWDRPAPAPADIAGLPRPLIGYVGSLEDRVDWRLLSRLSDAFPKASFVLVGKPGHKQRAPWYDECQAFLARSNVHLLGWRPQEQIALYNRAFDVCLIPYLTDHPFNQACCPTKIMDTMGTGRPIVATSLPECLLYDRLFHVAANERDYVESVRAILDSHSDDGRAGLRFEWAEANTCRKVADRLLDWLEA